MDAVIEVESLSKVYPPPRSGPGSAVTALDGLDLSIKPGEIRAVLGPNGAGKTTAIEILEGFRAATGGTVRVLGEDPAVAGAEWRERIGIVLQQAEAPRYLTVHELVSMYRSYYRQGLPVDEVIDLVGLHDKAGARIKSLSGGQKRRLDLAVALVGDPELVFLDEPTTGFDPSARREAWHLVQRLREQGRTVLLTTHYMDEAQHLADRITVIAGGKTRAEGTAAELADLAALTPHIEWAGADPAGLDLPWRRDGERIVVPVAPDAVAGTLHTISGWAVDSGDELHEFTIWRPTLEDTYLALVGQVAGQAAGAGRPEGEAR